MDFVLLSLLFFHLLSGFPSLLIFQAIILSFSFFFLNEHFFHLI